MASSIHYFGIRHHGPGSAKRLLAALDRLRPQMVLIEGPADCSALLPLLANSATVPPVALLAYVTERPDICLYYPFADYSPEYQACRWAHSQGAQCSFIDLPVAQQLAAQLAAAKATEAALEAQTSADAEEPDEPSAPPEGLCAADEDVELGAPELWQGRDPIGQLAKLAGYEDGEDWWNDWIEQNQDDDGALFATLADAMGELRAAAETGIEPTSPSQQRNLLREAYMRSAIQEAAKQCEGPIAVVCGAWHAQALNTQSAKADRERLKTLGDKLPASKFKTTLVPWTSPRLAFGSGYAAGVAAPMWYQHLWQCGQSAQRSADVAVRWLVQVAEQLRKLGHLPSTASVIEAVRLSQTLAALRNRPAACFDDLRDAIIACLCHGEAALWQQIENRLLLGNQVGQIPPDAPLAPLLEDLQNQQKRLKLKPEALPKEQQLDLRSGAGLDKSTLLHRLLILDVPWGRLSDSGSSRGTFRERWQLQWEPEFSVRLVENLVYGSTIAQAASQKLQQSLQQEFELPKLAEQIHLALTAQLPQAAEFGLVKLEQRAAQACDCLELLQSLPELVDILRYGTAREMSIGHLDELVQRLAIQGSLALPYASRDLDDEQANRVAQALSGAQQALLLLQETDTLNDYWWPALTQMIQAANTTRSLAGLAACLLYQQQQLATEHLALLLQRLLSPGVPVAQAAKFFEGFFATSAARLLYDPMLLEAVSTWLDSLEAEAFIEYLPLFRRVFAGLDAMERKRLLDKILRPGASLSKQVSITPETAELWQNHLGGLTQLIAGAADWATTHEH